MISRGQGSKKLERLAGPAANLQLQVENMCQSNGMHNMLTITNGLQIIVGACVVVQGRVVAAHRELEAGQAWIGSLFTGLGVAFVICPWAGIYGAVYKRTRWLSARREAAGYGGRRPVTAGGGRTALTPKFACSVDRVPGWESTERSYHTN